jgi:hypothetical protein
MLSLKSSHDIRGQLYSLGSGVRVSLDVLIGQKGSLVRWWTASSVNPGRIAMSGYLGLGLSTCIQSVSCSIARLYPAGLLVYMGWHHV